MANAESEFDFILDSPVGRVAVRLDGTEIHAVDFLAGDGALRGPTTPTARRVARAVQGYFAHAGEIDLPVVTQGTPFQQRVWRALRDIPVGRTLTYGQLARRLGTSARAVGNACRANPAPLVVPCHRVIAANGLGGFAGQTRGPCVRRKRWLLHHENPAAFHV